MEEKDKIISAFAFKTGKQIEDIIKEQTSNLEERNLSLEAKILKWYTDNGRDERFAEHFNIVGALDGMDKH